jgi:hypothetical protein
VPGVGKDLSGLYIRPIVHTAHFKERASEKIANKYKPRTAESNVKAVCSPKMIDAITHM